MSKFEQDEFINDRYQAIEDRLKVCIMCIPLHQRFQLITPRSWCIFTI